MAALHLGGRFKDCLKECIWHISKLSHTSGAGLCTLGPMGQIWPFAYLCVAWEINIVFVYLNGRIIFYDTYII